ncbi:MAG TPA: ESX secretion-associated protein EspG [Actinophytocola sp.]|uniref:ESX secretion-associated protein EspG n=1 Tax=Actinophytocola sp. TaxID=1872138 RepID=UPI002DBB42A3|nr:ESX secretion-associated protein EspG [Actinophytocola sp.]HEU5472139.1 ESX secretion-associated protein EspG [Actinophytocola sp.]
MTLGDGFDASLDVVEMDLLCTFAGVPAPFPLRVPSVGADGTERRALFGAARDRLTARGLADHRGPCGVAEEFVRLLRSSRASLDLLLTMGVDRLGAVLLGVNGAALLAVTEPDADELFTGLVALPIDDAVDELLRLLPELDAAMTTPFTLPRRAVGQVYAVLMDRARSRRGWLEAHELDELLGAHGIDERLARRMSTALQPVLGNGQAGLSERRGYAGAWRRVGAELRWLDTEHGRYKLGGDAEWTSVNPLFANELYASIRHLAAVIG